MVVGGVLLSLSFSLGKSYHLGGFGCCFFEVCVLLLCLSELLEERFGCSWKRLWVVVDESMSCMGCCRDKFDPDLSCECQGARI